MIKRVSLEQSLFGKEAMSLRQETGGKGSVGGLKSWSFGPKSSELPC